jgi:glutathione reductase (NADPH)
VAFIGGGFISFEFAWLARRAGAEVTIVHRSARVLKGFDAELAAALVARYRELGIRVLTDAPVTRVRREATALVVESDAGEIGADLVVHGAGRVADVDQLGLENADVEFGRHGVRVDSHMRSVSNPRFWAAGDAAALGAPLTPIAARQGRIVAAGILGEDAAFDGRATTSVVFSDPPMAAVGMDAEEAAQRGAEVTVQHSDMSTWFTQRRLGQTHAGAKVISDTSSGCVLGAHLLGVNAEEVINVFALAVQHGLTLDDLRATVWAYPTAGSDISYLV